MRVGRRIRPRFNDGHGTNWNGIWLDASLSIRKDDQSVGHLCKLTTTDRPTGIQTNFCAGH